MSDLGQKQTLGVISSMSVFAGKADIHSKFRNVRFVPIADICSEKFITSQVQVIMHDRLGTIHGAGVMAHEQGPGGEE